MNTKTLIVSTTSCVALLAGCAHQTAHDDMWTIKPTLVAQPPVMNPQAWYDLGRYYQGQERHALAASALENAVAADGTFAEARNRLGVSYALLGRYEEAIRQLEAAIQAAPEAAHIYSNLGYAHFLKGNPAEAASALQRAIALDPANRRAEHNLGLAYAQLGETAKARSAFAQAAAPQPELATAPATVPEESRSQVVQVAPNVYELRPKSSSTAAVMLPDRSPAPHARVEVSNGNGVNRMATKMATAPATAPEERRSQVVQVAPSVYELRPKSASTAAVVPPDRSPAPRGRVEVSNGNGVTGMARRVGSYLKGSGFAATRLTNQQGFGVAATRVEYRKGYEAEARQVAAAMPRSVGVMPNIKLRRDIGVRLVLGKDMTASLGIFEQKSAPSRLARNAQ
jgi:Flp pilus assembly protein TadD